jgi:antitoxin PrlF
MPSSTITIKGQTTIPKAVREHLKLQAGDRVDFIIQNDRSVVLKPATIDVSALKGLLRRPGAKPVSLEQMNAAVRRRLRRDK